MGRLGRRRLLPQPGHRPDRRRRDRRRGRRDPGDPRAFGASTAVQTIRAARPHRGLTRSTVDWHEREKFLKVAFPLDVHTDRAAYETQFGHLHRPTHDNTSWDAARFEVCAHRWVHVGEPGYGVAIANDSTYGHDFTGATRRRGRTRCGCRCCAPRGSPTRRPTRGRHRSATRWCPAPAIADAIGPATSSTCPRGRVAGGSPVRAAADRRRRPRRRRRGRQARRRPVAATWSSASTRRTAAGRPRRSRPTSRSPPSPRPTCSNARSPSRGRTVTLRPFQILTLRLARG